MHHKFNNNNVNIEYNMIICSTSNIDLIQGVVGYGDPEGITDWRITNTASGSSGTLNILNSISQTSKFTILENGNVGISNINPASLLDVSGDVNITGVYKRNNRDVIGDTSNYVLSTSNILATRVLTEVGFGSNYTSRLNTALSTRIDNTSNYVLTTSNLLANRVSSQWTNISTGIHYTPTKITSSPSATTIGSTSNFIYQVFTYTTETAGAGTGQTQYTLNVPTGGVVCDILIVGGGGGGAKTDAGGGGAGGLLYIQSTTLTGNYTINVGKGGLGGASASSVAIVGGKGANTSFIGTNANYIAYGGGGGGYGYPDDVEPSNLGPYGSSGGLGTGDQTRETFNVNTAGQGYLGGLGTASQGGGGGGGSGGTGVNSGNGGIGTQINITGTNLYYAGGGGGGHNPSGTSGGLGGGGSATFYIGNNATYYGGGGGGGGANWGNGGNGFEGIVIIRYISNTNIGVGTANPASELHVYDDTNNNTILKIENNYIDPVVVYPNTIGYTAVETLESSKYYRTLTFNYFPNYPENPANTSLLAWYRFNGDGLDYNPFATKYNLIANSGTPTYSSGTTADSFLQGRRYINTSAGSLRTTTLSLASRTFSVAVWVRTKTVNGGDIVVQSSSIGVNTTLILYCGGNNSYNLAYYGNDLNSASSYPADVNVWVHLVFVVLPNYNRRVYRNGALISTDSNTTAFSGTGDLRIGASYSSGGNMNIDISDLRIYTNGLSATEVATLYNSYINLEITDNYAVNFNKSTTLLVNNVSKTVNGLYNLSIGHINSSMLPAAGQADTPLASTAITSVAIKYEYTNTSSSLPNLITVSGATSSIIGTTERAISFTYTSDSSGLTGQTLYSFTPTEDLWCDILVVGGGGGGGHGGGGGGGVLLGTNLKLNAGITVSVKVGNGGLGVMPNNAINGANGADSSIIFNSIEYIAKGGGGGGSRSGSATGQSGNAGGSGGGGAHANSAPQGLGGVSNKIIYANFQSFGNNGGLGRPNTSGSEPNHTSGGGGGAGSAGNDFSYTTGGGNGGKGIEAISYFGTNVGHNGYFGGGGGGQTAFGSGNRGYGNGGLGLYGGGGDSAYEWGTILIAHNGLSNTGGGGGGGRFQGTAQGIAYTEKSGNGGSGFVIIRYRRNRVQSAALELIRNTGAGLPNDIVSNPVVSSSVIATTDKFIIFQYTSDNTGTGQTLYTFTTTEALMCDIFMIGGGGAGGYDRGGGGGAGGCIIAINQLLNIGTYNIKVGNGQQAISGGSSGSGRDSEIFLSSTILYRAKGGGVGGDAGGNTATSGGCGGGAASGPGYFSGGSATNLNYINGLLVNANTITESYANLGYKGGDQLTVWESVYDRLDGAGGGGIGGYGGNHGYNAIDGSKGGNGIYQVVINNVTYNLRSYFTNNGTFGIQDGTTGNYYIGGGGGGGDNNTGVKGNGGLGGGGSGGENNSTNVQPGSSNTGSGGGGAAGRSYESVPYTGGNGGSGIVIIRYRKANANYKIGNYGGDFKIISSTPAADTDYIRITSAGSSIYNPTGSPQWSTTSDRRIKENIEKASYTKCYDNINKLELYRFNYIKDFNNINKDLTQLGYIAQEVNEIFPKAVTTQHFNNDNLSVPDLLTIDITQINYSLYGTVKKLIEMYSDIEKQITMLEKLLNIDTSTSNLDTSTCNLIITDISTSNLDTLDTSTSNLIITDISTSNLDTLDTSTSNLIITDISTSNLDTLDTSTSNLIITDTSTSNLDTSTSNLIITDTSTSNLDTLDTSTSNLIITDNSTSNLDTLDTSTSNLIITDNSTSNLDTLDTSTSNLDTSTSNLIITDISTSNLSEDAS